MNSWWAHQDSNLGPTGDESLRDYAKAHSARCGRLVAVRTAEDAFLLLSSIATEHGLKPPIIKDKVTLEGGIKRLCDEFWWRRQLRRYCGRTAEAFAISIDMVHKHAGIYASNETVNRRRDQKQRASDLLAELVAINEDGQEFTLEQLAASSVSNPRNRRNELMTRIAGLEAVAKTRGDMALFLTVTCPSRMHARYSKSGQEAANYDGTTPREANQYLNKKVWSCIRSKFKRDGIEVYGFRVVEPMNDGTPHAHFLLFVSPENSEMVQTIFRTYALQEEGDEPGAKEHRFTVEVIDPKKGTATGYIAKYISKNIDGFGVDKDLYGHNAATSAERVSAWAAIWGIRQFQQFGGPSVTVWRELRRMGPQDNPEFEKIRIAADAGQWNEFTLLMGGPTASRKDQPVKLSRLFSAESGRYGEPKGEQVVGPEPG